MPNLQEEIITRGMELILQNLKPIDLYGIKDAVLRFRIEKGEVLGLHYFERSSLEGHLAKDVLYHCNGNYEELEKVVCIVAEKLGRTLIVNTFPDDYDWGGY